MTGPLEGITVVDLSAVVSGPMACQILGDQGAEVIKVEPQGIGDITRSGGYRVGTISAMYATCNRGKRSVVLDLQSDEGVAILKEITARADVFVQNFRPGAVERMGIGPSDLHADNPELIYVSISGFGSSGPYRDWRVYDPVIQAVSGVVSTQRSREIPIPDLVRTLICDKSTALTAAQAVSAALFARERGQARGQHIEIPMLDTALYWLWPDTFMGHTFFGDDVVPGPLLYDIYRLQPTADGHLVYFAASDSEFEGLCRALGHPEWWEDPRFNDITERVKAENFEYIGATVNAAFLTFPTGDILARLAENQVPSAPMLHLDEVFDDPQVRNNDAIHSFDHPTVGPVKMAKPPIRFSDTAHEPLWSLDAHGESTAAVLNELGYDADAVADLQARGVVGG